jgi:hypothetical protein
MPWYDRKFFYERGSINLQNVLRFDALPTQSFKSDDLLVFNNETNEVNSRTVASLELLGASRVNNGTISFWSDLGGMIGRGDRTPMPFIKTGPSGGLQQEIWPILPHSGGAFRDLTATYIGGGVSGENTPNINAATHGEYMPFNGKVYAYGINYDNYSVDISYEIFIMNYTTGDIQMMTSVTGGPSGPSSVSVIAGAGVPALEFSAGHHIGLAVKYDDSERCYMAVEGTIYFDYDYNP